MLSRLCDGLALDPDGLSVWMAGDDDLHALNLAWRGRDRPTDVLSFPQGEPVHPGAPALVGDVAISCDTAARQAADAGCSLEEEICRLLVHGVLHCVGHDHVHGGRQAARMRREESRLMAWVAAGPLPGCRPWA